LTSSGRSDRDIDSEFDWLRLASDRFCRYNNPVRITYDAAKREKALAERGLDFADAEHVFSIRKANEREQARITPLLEV
jgi:hypothetical protein